MEILFVNFAINNILEVITARKSTQVQVNIGKYGVRHGSRIQFYEVKNKFTNFTNFKILTNFIIFIIQFIIF